MFGVYCVKLHDFSGVTESSKIRVLLWKWRTRCKRYVLGAEGISNQAYNVNYVVAGFVMVVEM